MIYSIIALLEFVLSWYVHGQLLPTFWGVWHACTNLWWWYLKCAKGQGSLQPWKILFLLPQKSTPKIQFETTHPTLLLTIIIPAPRSTTFHDKVFPINYADPKRPITFILPLLKNISVGISPNLGLAPELWGLTISVMILQIISYFSKDTIAPKKKMLLWVSRKVEQSSKPTLVIFRLESYGLRSENWTFI